MTKQEKMQLVQETLKEIEFIINDAFSEDMVNVPTIKIIKDAVEIYEDILSNGGQG